MLFDFCHHSSRIIRRASVVCYFLNFNLKLNGKINQEINKAFMIFLNIAFTPVLLKVSLNLTISFREMKVSTCFVPTTVNNIDYWLAYRGTRNRRLEVFEFPWHRAFTSFVRALPSFVCKELNATARELKTVNAAKRISIIEEIKAHNIDFKFN